MNKAHYNLGRFARLMVATSLCGVLVACQTTKDANNAVAKISKLTEEQQRQMYAAQRGKIIYEPRPYYGEAVKVDHGTRSGKPLPKKLEGARGFKVDLKKPTDIDDIAKYITEETGLPVNIRRRYLTPTGALMAISIGGSIKITHEGALSKFLDIVSARMDIGWEYDGTAITFNRMITETYKLPIPTNSTEFSTSIAGVNGTSGGNRSVSLTKKISHDPWTELEAALKFVVPSPSSMILSKNAGRVTLFGSPSVQKAAKRVIKDYQNTYATRIGLEVAIYFVDADKSDDFGVGINLAKTDAGNTAGLLGAAGAVIGNGVITLSRGNSAVNFKALATNAAVVDYRLGSTIAQSGVVSPIVLTRSINYVASTKTTTSDSGNTTELKTATIDTGVSIHALPRLIDDNQIQLSLTIFQNDLTSLDSFTSGQSTVQLPVIDQRVIQNDSVLAPGETLILSGYEQEVARRTQAGTGIARFIGLGGSNKSRVQKIRMIVFVRPSIIAHNRGGK